MSIRIIETGEIFNCDLKILSWKSLIELTGSELPTEAPNNFEVIEQQGEELVVIDYFYGFSVIYDKGDEYIQLTNDTNTYYNYLLTDDNGFVNQIEVSTTQKSEAYLYQVGQGKQYKEPTFDILSTDGAPLWKIVDEELVETTQEERDAVVAQATLDELNVVINTKCQEISNACGEYIVNGIIFNNMHYPYELDDQNNILNCVNLARQTGLKVPYHAEGEACRLYALDEIFAIYANEELNLTHHVTYNNQLRLWIKTLTTKEEVEAVTYGMDLTGEYLETYNAIMTQTQALLESMTASVSV